MDKWKTNRERRERRERGREKRKGCAFGKGEFDVLLRHIRTS